MMSFVQMNKSEIVKKQYLYKLKAYKGSYSSLMIIQIIGLLFSIFAINSEGGSGSNFSYDFIVYSADLVVAFTLFWSFITGLTITSKNYRNDDENGSEYYARGHFFIQENNSEGCGRQGVGDREQPGSLRRSIFLA